MTTKLEMLRDLNTSLGFVRTIEQVPGDYDCPVHQTPIIEHQLETLGGWNAVMVCPVFDGSCRYDPDGEPMQIEPPAPADAEKADPAKTAAAGKAPDPGGF